MPDEFDDTNDMGVDVEEIPVYHIGTAGISSAAQLIDQTSDTKIISEATG